LIRHFNLAKHAPAGDGVEAFASRTRERGFSLLEMLISLAVLLVVISIAFSQIVQLQKQTTAESSRVDMNQQAREFIDQTVHDLHLSGYPNASMFVPPPPATDPNNNSLVAAGIVKVSPTQLIFEGDVNNDGQVYSVNISYVAVDPVDRNCPCIRRHVTPKSPGIDPLSQPMNANYTETEHVMPPGVGAGQSGEDLFAYYDQNGNKIDVSGGVDITTPPLSSGLNGLQTIASIKTVKVNLTLANGVDANGTALSSSLSTTVRLKQ
jgi:prepilin-type N-terminal cleavage/methylation domain-containing protein